MKYILAWAVRRKRSLLVLSICFAAVSIAVHVFTAINVSALVVIGSTGLAVPVRVFVDLFQFVFPSELHPGQEVIVHGDIGHIHQKEAEDLYVVLFQENSEVFPVQYHRSDIRPI